MRLVVTGANGLVGSRLCTLLAKNGHEVVALSRGERRANGPFRYENVDLTFPGATSAVVAGAKADVVVHCASMTVVDACEKDPSAAYANNVTATANLAQACRAAGSHLIHVSTDYVFDGEGGPYDEIDIPNPRGVYALSKHMAEHAVRLFTSSWAIARTAVVYGWPAAGRPNFGAWLVGALEKNEPVKLFQDQFVSPTLADSVAAMLAELAERRLNGIWHLAGAEVLNRVAFGERLCEVFGFDRALITPTRLKDMNLPSPRPLHTGLKVDKANARLLEKPLSVAEALSRFHQAYVAAKSGSAS